LLRIDVKQSQYRKNWTCCLKFSFNSFLCWKLCNYALLNAKSAAHPFFTFHSFIYKFSLVFLMFFYPLSCAFCSVAFHRSTHSHTLALLYMFWLMYCNECAILVGHLYSFCLSFRSIWFWSFYAESIIELLWCRLEIEINFNWNEQLRLLRGRKFNSNYVTSTIHIHKWLKAMTWLILKKVKIIIDRQIRSEWHKEISNVYKIDW
jgi:hypothetical protein